MRVNHFPKITELVHDKVRIQTQLILAIVRGQRTGILKTLRMKIGTSPKGKSFKS